MKIYILSLFLISLSIYNYACSCNNIPFKDAVEWADEIFIGRLIEIKEVEYEISELNAGEKYTRLWYAKFEITKKWKGSSKKYIKVYQPSTSCDFGFNSLNKHYLVYTKKEEVFKFFNTENEISRYTTWMCARNREYEFVNEPKDSDYFKLNKKFPNTIELVDNTPLHWKLPLLGVLIFISGLFIGRKIKSLATITQRNQ
ncbi:hypothetical protein [uncultured Tenacibaculum sp.]|uniref:hypothetical protein n=1 Tax=uncultured Tenacibaculum sp. TaxID=174713 RepID=UPI0026366CDC|nr:hypothetical protein [uncultured Tenacibaculum sp.]